MLTLPLDLRFGVNERQVRRVDLNNSYMCNFLWAKAKVFDFAKLHMILTNNLNL